MANSRKSAKKPATVTHFPQPQAVAVEENLPVEFRDDAQTPPQQPAPTPAPSRNPLKKKDPRLPTEGDFWSRLRAIPQQDWDSQRVYLYLYILEPLCNLKQSGGKSYLNRYSQPVRDEHQIAVEYGSGRYRLMLAYNKVSPDESTELARFEFEIYNPQFPPKVPKAAWINDSRNTKWEALLPKETPAASGGMVEAMKLVTDIRRDLREEMGDPEPPQMTSTSEVLETMKAAKELFGQASTPANPTKDPLEIAVALFQTMNQMKAENPVIDMYRDELKAMREELKEERARHAQHQQAPAKSLGDQLLELAAMGDKLEPIKKLLGFGNGGEATGRVARTTGLDLLRDFITSPAGTTVAQGLGALISTIASNAQPNNGAQPMQPRPVVINAQQPNGTVPPVEDPEQRIQRIGAQITEPMINKFMAGATGDDWAQSMFDLMPHDYKFMRELGAENIVERYRRFPQAWNILRFREAEFIEFIGAFCTWDPNEDEGPAPDEGDDGIVDVEAQS